MAAPDSSTPWLADPVRPADPKYEILPWDSEVFGFPVARVEATADQNVLSMVLDRARKEGAQLIYLFAEQHEAIRAAEVLYGKAVSERLVFARGLTAHEDDRSEGVIRTVAVERITGSTPTPELLQLARDAGQYSRFRVDPRVPSRVFERIYDAWIINSLQSEMADDVLVTSDASSVSGLVTVASKQGRAEIGLLAVREDARGIGIGKALVQAALTWGVQRQLQAAQVVTQRANVAACRLYTSCGYTIERAEHVFHLWL